MFPALYIFYAWAVAYIEAKKALALPSTHLDEALREAILIASGGSNKEIASHKK